MKKNQILITQFSAKAPKTCCFIMCAQVYTIKLVESDKKVSIPQRLVLSNKYVLAPVTQIKNKILRTYVTHL